MSWIFMSLKTHTQWRWVFNEGVSVWIHTKWKEELKMQKFENFLIHNKNDFFVCVLQKLVSCWIPVATENVEHKFNAFNKHRLLECLLGCVY